ncbi:MAG: S8 family serine peptidase [Patescibacteria group bacterium]
MRRNTILHRALEITGSLVLCSVLLVSFSRAILIDISAQTRAEEKSSKIDEKIKYNKSSKYEELIKKLNQEEEISVIVSSSNDSQLNQKYLENYAREYAKYFPEFTNEENKDLDKQELPPIYEELQQPLLKDLRKAGLEVSKVSFYSPNISLNITSAQQLERLFAIESIANIQENQADYPTLSNSNPVIKARDTWKSGAKGGGKNKIVAILDTGVQSDHPFLNGKVNIEACFSSKGNNVVSNCPNGKVKQYGKDSAAPCTFSSRCDHGTHVAGIAAGTSEDKEDDYHGVARDADIMAVQVFTRFNKQSSCGTSPAPCLKSYTQDQIDGLNYVGLGVLIQTLFNTTKRIASANMSLGSRSTTTSHCNSDARKSIIDTLNSSKVATVISAGNAGNFGISTPGCISSAITVGTTNNIDSVFYNRHPNLDLFAPGRSINSSITSSNYGSKSGTSMSAPMVAGAFAILSARLPSNSVNQNLKVLQDTGVSVSYTNSGTNYTEKRLRFCRSYWKYNSKWYCGLFIKYPYTESIKKVDLSI